MGAAVSFGCPMGPFVRAEIESRTEALLVLPQRLFVVTAARGPASTAKQALGSGRLIAADSVFQIASVSKTFAGVALALAQSEGSTSARRAHLSDLTHNAYRSRGFGQRNQSNAPGLSEFGLAAS